jgi:hypothetical protein
MQKVLIRWIDILPDYEEGVGNKSEYKLVLHFKHIFIPEFLPTSCEEEP